MIPGTSLVDWQTGEPNARYHALKLMVESVRIGDMIAPTVAGHPGFPDARAPSTRHPRQALRASST